MIEIGAFIEGKNTKGDVVARLVHVGDNFVETYHHYQDGTWQSHPDSRKLLGQPQLDAWASRQVGVMAVTR